ncbi:hypothetical protein ACVIDN_006519 [Rhizobium brockwellii]
MTQAAAEAAGVGDVNRGTFLPRDKVSIYCPTR